MKIIMRILYVSLLIILLCPSAYASDPEIVYYEGTPYKLFKQKPLESFYANRDDRPRFQISADNEENGYVGRWEIKDERLYLIGIDGWIRKDKGKAVEADLKTLFGKQCIDGRVAATWFTGELRLPYGNKVLALGGGEVSFIMYEWDIVIQVEAGKVTGITTVDNRSNGLLLNAAMKGSLTDVQTALADGADINTKDPMFKGTPLMWASSGDHADIVTLLLEKGADIKGALFRTGNKIEIVRLLLDKGADVNERQNNGTTPLVYASEKGYAEIVRLLLDRGADINSKIWDGGTALSTARKYGHPDIVLMLQNAGAKE